MRGGDMGIELQVFWGELYVQLFEDLPQDSINCRFSGIGLPTGEIKGLFVVTKGQKQLFVFYHNEACCDEWCGHDNENCCKFTGTISFIIWRIIILWERYHTNVTLSTVV